MDHPGPAAVDRPPGAGPGLAGRALKARMPEGWEPTEEQVDIGLVHSEKALPFTINAAGILGMPQSVVAYSRPAAQTKYFFTGGSAFRAFPGQGYIGLRVR
ncbi:tRNA-dependent cyclodipeptide synthase [Streptomyces sp. AM 4-1-1]|uniref:tRNA-dependent cyclodipeptide synthase n=1 Tax=Streptomyces sp. AM 4-1-1 TaxID=3028710 RepID=UPI0023BA2745|nr:tRNA-dependent cyclodipeptide synthase [Streptomyces sp. AM 4-1-1]WEH31960.1 tRNA-dependent cyclodipeptide synthase [Streptomyces sp. AM 4-1-1]